jgi:hypothetical protein
MEIEQLSQVSALVNLRHLERYGLHHGVSGGFPSQLTALTCLHAYCDHHGKASELLEHLSSLTALQQLSLQCDNLPLRNLSGIQSLSELTGLELFPSTAGISISSTDSWASLTALKRLALKQCTVNPGAFSRLTQLQELSLTMQGFQMAASIQVVLDEVAQLSFLTDLELSSSQRVELLPVAAFTSFTASTNLCSLQLGLSSVSISQGGDLFRLGFVCPRLRVIDLTYTMPVKPWEALPLTEQQLQRLCSCCPALESLDCSLAGQPSSTALFPLQQLSALTRLGLHRVGAAAVLGGAAWLTGLKQLVLGELPQLVDPALLHLTALVCLEELSWSDVDWLTMSLQDKVSLI